MNELIATLMVLSRGAARRLRRSLAAAGDSEAGLSTLEMVILALGLMALAATLVAALTMAVTSRTEQIK